MNYRALRKFVISALVISSIATSALAGDRTPAGRTITWTGNDGLPFHVTFYAGGRAQARSDNGSSSRGTWNVTGPTQVCIDWENPNWRRSCRPF
jgi:hypothetical protein